MGKLVELVLPDVYNSRKSRFLINFWQTISGSSEKYDNLIPLPADVWSCSYFLKMLFSPYRPRLSTMEKIRQHVEEVSRQSFFVGWMKVDPSVVNQIENPWILCTCEMKDGDWNIIEFFIHNYFVKINRSKCDKIMKN